MTFVVLGIVLMATTGIIFGTRVATYFGSYDKGFNYRAILGFGVTGLLLLAMVLSMGVKIVEFAFMPEKKNLMSNVLRF